MTECNVPNCHQGAVGRFLVGRRCADHTPAAEAGRPEPVGGPGWPATLQAREPWPYGSTTTDPLGREGPGWKYRTRNWGIPSRVKDAAS